MDEKSILLMSEELRAALGERVRADVESEPLPGRWSKMSATGGATRGRVDEMHIAARVVKCTTVVGKGIRLTLCILDETKPADLIEMIDQPDPVTINAGSGALSVVLRGRLSSVRIDSGSPARITVMVKPVT